jgi:hypothetical protein
MKASDIPGFASAKILHIYYAATLLFVFLDYFLNINVRLAFLEAWPEMRALYYLLCFVCLGLMTWRPAWSLWIGTVESMLAASLLIITFGVRVMTMSEQMLQTGTGLVTMSEIMNFMIVGLIAAYSFNHGIAAIQQQSRLK